MTEVLYSPWRMKYINAEKKDKGCIFCLPENRESDEQHFVLYRSRYSFVIMNMYPYNNGHLLIVPLRHVNSLLKLSDSEYADFFNLVKESTRIIEETYGPEGINLGMNLGQAAGAGIAEHIHMHLVPRWSGDVNFMTSICGTRVIPEDFESTYKRLKKQFDKLDVKKKSGT